MAPVRLAGSTIQPVQDAYIIMVSEKVEIAIKDSMAYVTCRFELKNEGEPKRLMAGFPSYGEGYRIQDFRAWVDEKEVPVRHYAPVPTNDPGWKPPPPFSETFYVPFDSSGQTVTVINRYRISLIPEGSMYHSSLEDLGFVYFLETGAFWKETIDEAIVTVDFGTLPPVRIGSIKPSGYAKTGNTVTWRFTNFEPEQKDNIDIRIIQKAVYDNMAEAWALLQTNPKSARGHYLLGTVLFNRSVMMYDNRDIPRAHAEKEFLKALELDPGLLDARYFLAAIYYLRSHRRWLQESARAQLQEILRRDPDYSCKDAAFPARFYGRLGNYGTRASSLLAAYENLAGSAPKK
jgi:hypothetical protein